MKLALLSISLIFISLPVWAQSDGFGEATNLAVMADSNWNCSKQIMSRDLEELIDYSKGKNVCDIPRCIEGKKCKQPCELMNLHKKLSLRHGVPAEYLHAVYSNPSGIEDLTDAEYLMQLKQAAIRLGQNYKRTANIKDSNARFDATVCLHYGESEDCLKPENAAKADAKIVDISSRYRAKPWESIRDKKHCDIKETKVATELNRKNVYDGDASEKPSGKKEKKKNQIEKDAVGVF